jgi:hypothetical protein
MIIIKKIVEKSIPKEEFETALDIKIIEWYLTNDCLKIYSKDRIFYLRCDDIRKLLGIKYNIFSFEAKIDKKCIKIGGEKEIFRGDVKKWKKNSLN